MAELYVETSLELLSNADKNGLVIFVPYASVVMYQFHQMLRAVDAYFVMSDLLIKSSIATHALFCNNIIVRASYSLATTSVNNYLSYCGRCVHRRKYVHD